MDQCRRLEGLAGGSLVVNDAARRRSSSYRTGNSSAAGSFSSAGSSAGPFVMRENLQGSRPSPTTIIEMYVESSGEKSAHGSRFGYSSRFVERPPALRNQF